MSWELNAQKEWAKEGRLYHDDNGNTVFDGHIIIQAGKPTSNALPKELAIKFGFIPKLNQHGARQHSYVEKRFAELLATGDPIDRKVAVRLPRWFVIEDELNNPPLGSTERITLDKNRDSAIAEYRVNQRMPFLRDAEGYVINNHAYYFLGNAGMAEKALGEFVEEFDKYANQVRTYVSNNSRID